MNPERWKHVKILLDQAIAVKPDERDLFLDRQCGGDLELKREVSSLLASHDDAGGNFLNTPAADLTISLFASPARIGSRIGAYRIIEEIGAGGMGEVYRAVRDDGQYTKEVAVKLVRTGHDTKFVLQRFLNERQILASLDHPYIARLLDGGTTEDGIPYLVMDLIDGEPIDSYCDKNKLNITRRLWLFRQVCEAVHYAHQRLVIHRDIKPGNVLITKDGTPKLLDFGIAKIVGPSEVAQTTLTLAMTPEFASPEQIRGETITTASDVYSLGVVLYQLLTGRSPYTVQTRTPHVIAQAVCEGEPGRPSTMVARAKLDAVPGSACREGSTEKLRRRLAGDLDDIVLMALRKEPSRRYGSVEQFAEDIRRHLEGMPVVARKGSWSYRAGKFVRRHTVGVVASAVVAIAVAGGVTMTIREARIAAAHQRRAEQRFNDVRKLANSLMFEIHDAIRDLPGSTPARRLLVTRAQEYLDSLNGESKGDPSLQKELASAYERVGDVLGYPYAANLGDKPGALANYRKAQAIRESLTAIFPNDVDLQRDLSGIYFRLADVLESSGNFEDALAALAKAQPITERLAAHNSDPVSADMAAGSYYFTAGIEVQMGNLAAAEQDYQRSAEIRGAALEANPGNFVLRTHQAADYAGMAKCMELKKNLDQAIPTQLKATAILQEVSQSHPENATISEYLGEGLNRLGTYRYESGDAATALETYRRAHQIFGGLLAADPKNSLARSNFGFSDNGIARSLMGLGKQADAVAVFHESAKTFAEMAPGTSSNRYLRTGLAEAYFGLGEAYSALAAGKNLSPAERRTHWDQAHASCEKSLALWKDKEKRGELESDETENLDLVAQCVAKTETHLGAVQTAKASR